MRVGSGVGSGAGTGVVGRVALIVTDGVILTPLFLEFAHAP